ncbi:MAG: (2Fe-2S)-binding protein [Melioribacteraceae bacterium]|nr:(2Fe-2S)-binding protein [Melioribacteraceae bacterium]MCF8355675.1 (2Fe-2S)-binding protein [Melioribacteraceae bacterium]MCF8396342.1 (2Fe-2S)-binding protein [Melioribacteraceae bacterium]MCF8420325.1 (2Fe-2S)-binding protein [Melioribacteraceae bacterium]
MKDSEAKITKSPKDEVLESVRTETLETTINGRKVKSKVEPRTTLADFLRDYLELTGTKVVCNHGECGGCSVILDGRAVYSCMLLALDANGKEVITIEGLMSGENLHPLQQAFIEHDGLQCGFCTPGQIMAAYALLKKFPNPTDEQIMTGMSGNLCRCAAYPNIIKSVRGAAKKMNS